MACKIYERLDKQIYDFLVKFGYIKENNALDIFFEENKTYDITKYRCEAYEEAKMRAGLLNKRFEKQYIDIDFQNLREYGNELDTTVLEIPDNIIPAFNRMI